MPARKAAEAVVRHLKSKGHTTYFAGGWVRDLIMKHPSDDIDIATSASAQEVQKLFPKTIPVGVAFGIVIVVMDEFQFEVATFRKESGYLDGRRPTSIEPALPEEDAKRRDFTINGMFFDPLTEEIFDFVDGKKDIERKLIRAIGDPHERFLEDRLRMMRAVRYATRFDYTIEKSTLEAIRQHASSLYPAVAVERVWQEFKKMSQFAHFDRGLLLLHELGLLPTIFPSLKDVSIEEMKRRVAPIDGFPSGTPPVAELVELFPVGSLNERLALCDSLKLSREERDLALYLHDAHTLLTMPSDWQRGLEPIEWVRFYAKPHVSIALLTWSARLKPDERKSFEEFHAKQQKQMQPWIQALREKKPFVTSADLLQAGVSPGKRMGELLTEAERIAANNSLVDKGEILKRLKM